MASAVLWLAVGGLGFMATAEAKANGEGVSGMGHKMQCYQIRW